MADAFEDLVYSEEDVIIFEKGIPGFGQHKKYVLVKVPGYDPFEWLVNIEAERLRFALINPLLFKPDYNPKITKKHIEGLGLEKPEDVLIYAIVTLSKNTVETTANLMGPILINRAKRLGKQIILEESSYSLKERILN